MTIERIESSSSPANLLDETFVYQNATTGQVAGSRVTVRQLCRILSTASTHVITPKTQILRVLENGQYDAEWKCAQDTPVLREACSQFYFLASNNDKKNETKGPVTCRELAKLLSQTKISHQTKVWSPKPGFKGWFAIKDSVHLLAALGALEPQKPFPWDDGKEKEEEEANQKTTTFDTDKTKNSEIEDELEAFLNSTVGSAGSTQQEEDEGYQSDGGTEYVKDPTTGNWIHAALAPSRPDPGSSLTTTNASLNKKTNNGAQTTKGVLGKKRKKPKFSSKNMRNWIYVTGLPQDTNEEEVASVFSKAGIIELDAETQHPKIKLYRHKDGSNRLKGDASICFARPESVDLALQLLDESQFRPSVSQQSEPMRVSKAKFEQHGESYAPKKAKTSNAKRKVARLAALQAVGWDEGDNGRIAGGRKGLCIIVLKGMFTLSELEKGDEDAALADLEKDVRKDCSEWGTVTKITVFSKNPQGVVVVRFTQPTAATTAVTEYNGRLRKGRRINAAFWDGVTDFTMHDEEAEEKEAEKRLEEFGSWLDNQDELPEELRLQVEGE